MQSPLWDLCSVSVAGRAPAARLHDVTLAIPAGRTAVVGPSGAGKSTLLHLLVGFERPTGGVLGGEIPDRLFGARRADGAGRRPVSWSPSSWGLWPQFTVREHLEAVAPASPAVPIDEWLRRFDLLGAAGARPGRLSWGERSRLSVARALATEAEVVVLDEPLAHVDPRHAEQGWQAIRDGLVETGASLVFATHDAAAVLFHAERLIGLEAGRVAVWGVVDEVYHRPPSREIAELLGRTNWFEPGALSPWGAAGELSTAGAGPCVRPERVRIEEDPQGPCTVAASRFGGELTATDLVHLESGEQRTVLHRPARPLDPGRRAALKLLGAGLFAWTVSGCGPQAATKIDVGAVRTWLLPPAGRSLPAPRGVGPDGTGALLVLDTVGRVLKFSPDGELLTSWWMPEFEAGRPEGVCALPDGRIAVADTHYHRLVLFAADGTVDRMLGREGTSPGEFIYPVDVACTAEGDLLVCEYGGNDRVQQLRPDGEFVRMFGSFGTGPGQFQRPSGLVADDGRILVADAINNRVLAFLPNGDLVGPFAAPEMGAELGYPYDITRDEVGRLYVVEYSAGRITRFEADGRFAGTWGETGREANQLFTPWGLCWHGGALYVADTGNRRMVRIEL